MQQKDLRRKICTTFPGQTGECEKESKYLRRGAGGPRLPLLLPFSAAAPPASLSVVPAATTTTASAAAAAAAAAAVVVVVCSCNYCCCCCCCCSCYCYLSPDLPTAIGHQVSCFTSHPTSHQVRLTLQDKDFSHGHFIFFPFSYFLG